MDPFTHALSGALLVRATSPIPSSHATTPNAKPLPLRLRIAAGFFAAAFPDLDFALRLIDTLTYLNWHQGPTHSLVLLPLWGWLLARLFARITQYRYTWQHFFTPVCLGLAAHLVGDLITSYGLMLFAPFSTERYALPLAFVIDPWFSFIIIIGLLVSWFVPNRKTAAIAALSALAGYLLLLLMLRTQALDIGQNFAETHNIPNAHISAQPQPLSPSHWKIIIRQGDLYDVALVDLWQNNSQPHKSGNQHLLTKMAAAYQPITVNHWHQLRQFGDNLEQIETVRQAWQQPAFAPFRKFSHYPVLARIDNEQDLVCYWFYDMRFAFPTLPPSFQFGICHFEQIQEWQLVRHRGLFYID